MNDFKLLEISDSYRISDFIKQSDVFVNTRNNIISAHYNIQEFEEVAIREHMFNYEILSFASLIDAKIDSLIYYVLPKDISNVTSIELKLLTNINTNNVNDLIDFSVSKINEIFESLYKRITIYVKEEELDSELKNRLKELKFEQEISLRNELGINQNVIIFVRTI